jgi:hypothetical protein
LKVCKRLALVDADGRRLVIEPDSASLFGIATTAGLC